ncbi:MAG: nitroreductase [Clostridiales bacterium]|nr:nitroreductase [Clostridiales bacterium]
MEQLYGRKSVRVYEDKEIDEAIVQEILTAATMAPTAGNQQLYTILRITDDALKRSLSESCDHQPFIAEGKLILIFLADCLKWHEAFRYANCEPRMPGEGDLMIAVSDALIAAQNAVVAAESYGIGSCYIGDIMENVEIHRKVLNLPKYVFPAAMLVFGYPTEQQKQRKKPPRCKLEHIVHENTYRQLDEAELRRMLVKNCTEETYDSWIQAFCKRKYNSDFSREMTRSVRQYLLDFAESAEE